MDDARHWSLTVDADRVAWLTLDRADAIEALYPQPLSAVERQGLRLLIPASYRHRRSGWRISANERPRKDGVAPVHSLPDRPALTKAELARAYWRAVSTVRRFKLKNVYNLTLVASLEREFRAAWDDPLRRTRRVFELHS